MKPLKTLERMLYEILEPWSWEEFETVEDGHRQIWDHNVSLNRYDFYLRVGTHMNRPMQVIMSCGKFLRMRKEERWPGFPIVSLDPKNPESSLYTDMYPVPSVYDLQQAVYHPGHSHVLGQAPPLLPTPKRGWKPTMPNYGYTTQGAAWATTTGGYSPLLGLGHSPSLPRVK